MTDTSQDRGVWRVLLVLLAAVLVPTACVLYFTTQAVRNARLAVRQKLIEAYEPPLEEAASEIASYWQEKAAALTATAADATPPARFAALVASSLCAGAVIYDEAGNVAYPAEASASDTDGGEAGAPWAEVRRLVEAGDTDTASELLAEAFASPERAEERDAAGRLIAPLAGLRALELLADPGAARYVEVRDALTARLNDYSPPAMPSAQRRFLMRRLLDMPGKAVVFPTFAAEELTANYLVGPTDKPPASALTPSTVPGVWHLAPEGGRVVGLFKERRFLEEMDALLQRNAAMPGTVIELRRPDEKAGHVGTFLAEPVGAMLPRWRLALTLQGEDPFAAAAEREVAGYLWASFLSIGALVVMMLMAGRYLLRQMKLTRLKNDFIATVTHELKTPLSSIRLFAETLRERRYQDDQQRRRYLDLLVKENERLTRLIDNFLSFSRMERDRQAFDFAEVAPENVVQTALGVVSERFESEGCRLDMEVETGLPRVMADADALVTVILNLLDNAFKYTGQNKHIALRAYARDGQVCLEVQDNGLGMSRRHVRKAFDRFYQADSRLSRPAEGCGLGLSIVKFIVEAHGGTVEVESEPGKGSTFTVRLPAARSIGTDEDHGALLRANGKRNSSHCRR